VLRRPGATEKEAMSTITAKRYERPQAYNGIITGVVAGLIAGAIVDAFLFATGTLTWPKSYEFIASALAGKIAFESSAYVPLGIAIHFAISVGWGALFGLAAQRYRALIAHPLTSGFAFGVVVLIAMQLLLLAAGMWQAPRAAGQIVIELVSHTVFFGMPIAWYVAYVARRSEIARAA
jgi:hypothetical protein